MADGSGIQTPDWIRKPLRRPNRCTSRILTQTPSVKLAKGLIERWSNDLYGEVRHNFTVAKN